MGESDAAGESAGEQAPAPRRVLRTVSPPYRGRPDAEMTTVGWMLFLGLVVLLVPLLPFLVVVWLVSRGIEFANRQRT